MTNEHILVIEDNEKNLKLARDLLRFRGYRVSEARTAEEGLALAAAEPPNLVLMDIQLPGMNGIQALQALRAQKATEKTPIIAFTASMMTQDRSLIMKAGFDGVIFKPIVIREFCDYVAAVLAPIAKGN